jgi:hypothetical protein
VPVWDRVRFPSGGACSPRRALRDQRVATCGPNALAPRRAAEASIGTISTSFELSKRVVLGQYAVRTSSA